MPLQYYIEANIVLHNYHAIYFYIPKVACSSIKSVCFDLLHPGKATNNIHNFDYPCVKRNGIAHNYNNYFKFAFVRNPWDRLVSCYRNKIRTDNKYNDNEFTNGVFNKLLVYNLFWAGMTFEDFVDAVCKIPDQHANPHFRSQHTFIVGEDGKLLTNNIGKFEKLDSDFSEVCKKIGAPSIALPHLMLGGKRINYRSFYTDKTRNLVTNRYSRDITLFDYDF